MEVDVAIVGGGMAGLALAVALQERGIQAQVFEKAPAKRKHFGTGMSIGQNGIRALEGIKPGLSEKMESLGQRTRQFTTTIRQPGEPEIKISPSSQLVASERMFTITWKSACDSLLDSLIDSDKVHRRHTLIDYKPVEDGVEALFEVQVDEASGLSTAETKVTAKLLVGADGVWSRVRELMVGDEPRNLNLVTWLGIVPTDIARSMQLHQDDEISFISYPSKRTGIITCHCGSGQSLWHFRIPDESGELMKSFTSDFHDHGQEARKMRVLKRIEAMKELQNMKTVIERTESSVIREDRNFDRLPLSSWSDPSGHVVLLGDAAHGMYPGPGMGARVAFEDAHQLALLLHEAFSSPTPATAVPAAIKRYEHLRIPRCTALQGFAAELTTWPAMIPELLQSLSPEQKAQRVEEFFRWINKYPAAMAGDPDSSFWKPEQVTGM